MRVYRVDKSELDSPYQNFMSVGGNNLEGLSHHEIFYTGAICQIQKNELGKCTSAHSKSRKGDNSFVKNIHETWSDFLFYGM